MTLAWLAAALGTAAVSAETAACSAPMTASACYERYLEALQSATSLTALHPFLSSDRVRVLSDGLEQARHAGIDPGKIERVTLAILRRSTEKPLHIAEERTAEGVRLAVKRPSAVVHVRFVLERGTWRIADEQVTARR